MTSWADTNPDTSTVYTSVLSALKDRDKDALTMLNNGSFSNLPTDAKRWNTATNRFENWNGATWEVLTATYAINVDQVDGYHAGNGSGAIPISNGTLNTNLNADRVDGYHAGNGSGAIPISNGTLNTNLNADRVDGIHASQFMRNDSTNTISAPINMQDYILQRPKLKDYGESVDTVGSSGASVTIDLTDGNIHDVTLTNNCTFTFSNPPTSGNAGSFTLILRQNGTGGYSVTWPASVDWSRGVEPVLDDSANSVSIITFFTVDGGTTWYGASVGTDFS